MDKSYIIAFLLGSVTTLIGSVTTHIFNERRERRKEFKNAAIEFRKAFQDVLLYLQDDPIMEDKFDEGVTFVGQFLEDAYSNHLRARNDFIIHLGCWRSFRLNRAWNKYIYPQKRKKNREYGFEFDFYSKMNKWEARRLALKRIEKILSFTK